jgi:hypothetical protein
MNLEITSDEALVLFDFLARYSEHNELRIDDQAEQRVLWNLCCVLEKSLPELFDSNYKKLLADARSRVRDQETTKG